MPVPKLSPLQSRLAASLIASFMLLMLYLAFAAPHFAYAADVDSIAREDHNHERLLSKALLDIDVEDLESRTFEYEADFIGYDRGIIGRAPNANTPTALVNNQPDLTNVPQGMTMQYVFQNASLWGDLSAPTAGLPSAIEGRDVGDLGDDEEDDEEHLEVELRSRQVATGAQRTLYVTVNTCMQPSSQDTSLGPPPQLQLYVSQSPSNTLPGPGQDPDLQDMITLDNGAGMMAINATGDVFIGLSGVNTTAYSGVWSASVAASIDSPYHYYHGQDPNLFLVDSDSASALLITNNLTDQPENSTVYQEWMNLAPPFVMFASNHDNPSILGLQNSYCGLEKSADIAATNNGQLTNMVQVGMTSRGLGNLPKQQFYFNGLTAGSSYYGVLAMNGNSTESGGGVVGGGGQVWSMMNFTSLSGMSRTYCHRWIRR